MLTKDKLETVTRKRLLVPTIQDFSFATHTHNSKAQGGALRLSLPIYADNAAALAGGLVPGDLYRTGGDPDYVCIVH